MKNFKDLIVSFIVLILISSQHNSLAQNHKVLIPFSKLATNNSVKFHSNNQRTIKNIIRQLKGLNHINVPAANYLREKTYHSSCQFFKEKLVQDFTLNDYIKYIEDHSTLYYAQLLERRFKEGDQFSFKEIKFSLEKVLEKIDHENINLDKNQSEKWQGFKSKSVELRKRNYPYKDSFLFLFDLLMFLQSLNKDNNPQLLQIQDFDFSLFEQIRQSFSSSPETYQGRSLIFIPFFAANLDYSFFNKIRHTSLYPIGIEVENKPADGFWLTPASYFAHDILHALTINNRKDQDERNLETVTESEYLQQKIKLAQSAEELDREFWEKISSAKNLNADQFNKMTNFINLIIFFTTHENALEFKHHQLQSKINKVINFYRQQDLDTLKNHSAKNLPYKDQYFILLYEFFNKNQIKREQFQIFESDRNKVPTEKTNYHENYSYEEFLQMVLENFKYLNTVL